MALDVAEIVSTIVTSLIGLAIGVITFFLKRTMGDLDKKASQEDVERLKADLARKASSSDIDAIKADVLDLRDDIKALKADSISKQDFIREITALDTKLDRNHQWITDYLLKQGGGRE